MGREVRMVPPDWEHPTDDRGNYIPLLHDFRGYCVSWCEEFYESREWRSDTSLAASLQDLVEDPPPKREDYMPEFNPGEATHYCMYETVSVGTPISPPMPTPESLAQWLADNGASSFGYDIATYEQWLATIKAGSAVSMVVSSERGVESGVAYMGSR